MKIDKSTITKSLIPLVVVLAVILVFIYLGNNR
jgi:hypothetical protein